MVQLFNVGLLELTNSLKENTIRALFYYLAITMRGNLNKFTLDYYGRPVPAVGYVIG